jgi:uncharacterized protein YndB with AHSA1/START domain
MTNNARPGNQIINKVISISAPPLKVWEALTDIKLMKQWMAEEQITILTNWEVGSPIVIKGDMHWVYFENTGTVLKFEPEQVLKYNHLSSLSRLRDEPESYSAIEFRLSHVENKTSLALELSGFATEAILKHLDFYWTVTLEVLKKFVEGRIE